VIHENSIETAITKAGVAEFSNSGRRLYPARRFYIELSYRDSFRSIIQGGEGAAKTWKRP
jgi:hypothetical protein